MLFCHTLSTGYNLTSNSMKGDQRIQTYHRFVEAAKFANGQKHVIRDPAINYAKVWIKTEINVAMFKSRLEV
jgi:hypothetical protein